MKTDENGRKYVTLGYLEKHHQGLEKNDIGEEPRMYGQVGDLCPVSSFKLYLYISKLKVMVQRFSESQYELQKQWAVVLQHANRQNTPSSMMKNMSKVAGLSRVYTNHCLRVTTISVLHAHGVDGEDIRSVSRHRSTDGSKPYCQGPTIDVMTWANISMSMEDRAQLLSAFPRHRQLLHNHQHPLW